MRSRQTLAVAVLVVLAFAGGFVARQLTEGSTKTDLTSWALSELEAHYYKAVDPSVLSTTGVKAMLASLKDPWTVFLSANDAKAFSEQLQGTYSGIGAYMGQRAGQLVVIGVFDRSPAKQAGILAGDVIVAINDKPTKGEALDASVARITGPAGTRVKLQISRKGQANLLDFVVTRRQIATPETSMKMLSIKGERVGYVQLFSFARGVGATVRKDVRDLQAQGAKWIILDLRDNPGGLLDESVAVASDFLRGGVVVTTKGLHDPREVLNATGHPATSLPMVVLVNRSTASAAEIVTGALQDHKRAEVIGTRTFGKGLVQTTFSLPDGSSLKMTIAVYLTPAGRDINKKGLTPDLAVTDNPTTPKDEQLQAALSFIAGHH
jgi:carboxyl-terminal processing protease